MNLLTASRSTTPVRCASCDTALYHILWTVTLCCVCLYMCRTAWRLLHESMRVCAIGIMSVSWSTSVCAFSRDVDDDNQNASGRQTTIQNWTILFCRSWRPYFYQFWHGYERFLPDNKHWLKAMGLNMLWLSIRDRYADRMALEIRELHAKLISQAQFVNRYNTRTRLSGIWEPRLHHLPYQHDRDTLLLLLLKCVCAVKTTIICLTTAQMRLLIYRHVWPSTTIELQLNLFRELRWKPVWRLVYVCVWCVCVCR